MKSCIIFGLLFTDLFDFILIKGIKACPGSMAVMNPVSLQENGLLMWQRDGVGIQETTRYDFSAYNHVLQIYDVKPNDAGVYTALANDGNKTMFTLQVPGMSILNYF